MYRVYFYNFGYYSQNEGTTLEEARTICRRAGFQSRVEHQEEIVATWCPIGGWRVLEPVRKTG